MKEISSESVNAFQEKVIEWWSNNARELPWRKHPTPYHVLVSEMMLQQTQVSRVVPKYTEFLKEFPDLKALAEADTKRLLQVWSGLGYNRRALWLRDAARAIVDRGEFPRNEENLRKMRGIGPYTSRSILIFAFNEDLAAIDTNIRRILIASGFADECTSRSELQEVAERLLLRGRARDWHNALMDYGSKVLTSASTGIKPISQQNGFEGSSRQLRGDIVRILAHCEELSLEDLVAHQGCSDTSAERVRAIVTRLTEDGLVERTEANRFRIAR